MSSSPEPKSDHQKNALEWTVFGLSLALLAGVIGTLIHQAFTVGDEPARLTLQMGEPLLSHGNVRLPVSVTNEGDLPAISVEIEVTGIVKDEEETSTVSFDYVPHRARRHGWVIFPGEVTPSGLSARVLGYTDP